jgi:hypothetical protein
MCCHIAEEWRLICTLCYGVMSDMLYNFMVCSASDWAGDSCEIWCSHSCVTKDSSFPSVILCQTLLDCLTHEGEGITVFWNAASHSTNNTVSHPRRCEALGYIYWLVEGTPVLWFIAMKQKLFLTCMHSLPETHGRHAQFTWDTWVPCTAYPRHVGSPSRLIVRHPLNWHSLNFFGLTQGWQTFLRAHAPIVGNFWRNSFAFRKPEFTSTIFPVIPVTS